MRIAGKVAELFQLAENGERRIGTEYPFEFWKVGDLLAAQVLMQDVGVEGGGPHNVIVPTENSP